MDSVPVVSWLDEPIKQSVASVFAGINTSVEALDLFRSYRRAHFAMVQELVGKVKVLGMASPLPLANFYYPARVSSEIRRRLYKPEWLKPGTSDITPKNTQTSAIDGSQYAEKCQRLIVLGGPGAGKTTFLKYLALSYIDKDVFKKTRLKTSKLPFFVSLPELAKSEDSVVEFISKPLVDREGSYAKDYILRALKKSLAVVFFDSLDEVPLASRDSVLNRIRSFSNVYSETKIVLSCRTADYRDNLESFDEVELVKLSKEAVSKIICSWFQSDSDAAQKLLSVIKNDHGISSLTETPLLLSLLCIQFRHDLVLPRRKVDIYKRCVETLLRDWDTSRGFRRQTAYESLSDAHKERLFEHVAGHTLLDKSDTYIFQKSRLNDLTGNYIRKLGLLPEDSDSVIREIESHHGIIEQHSFDTYCFSHTSIHDYFAARYAISRQMDISLLKSHIDDESWANIIIFMCGLHADPRPIFDHLAMKAQFGSLKNYPAIERRAKLLFLVYRCMAVGPILDPEHSSNYLNQIADSITAYSKLMSESGVYPMCSYVAGGVRHPYVSKGAKRPSLHAALLPLRKLSNEILANPIDDYADIALARFDEVAKKGQLDLLDISIALNLIVPLSKGRPTAVFDRLSQIRDTNPELPWFMSIVGQSMASIERPV